MARRAEIKIEGRYAWLSMSPRKKAVNDELEFEFTWTDPEDLSISECFYFRKTGQLLHGLAWKAKKILERHGYTVTCRLPVIEPDPTAAHWKVEKPPRSVNQKMLADAASKSVWGSFVGPPAIGKTYILVHLAAEAKVTTLVVSYQAKPNKQVAKAFADYSNFHDKVIVLDGDTKMPASNKINGAKVIVATIQKLMSLRRQNHPLYRQIKKKVKLLLFDEAHHAKATRGMTLLEDLKNLKSCGGVTATWGTTDGKEIKLEGVIGPIRAKVLMKDAIDEGDICPTTLHIAAVPSRYYFMDGPKNKKKKKADFEAMLAGGMTPASAVEDKEEKVVDRRERLQQYLFVERDYIVEGATGRNKIIAEFVSKMREKGRTGAIIISKLPHAEALMKVIPNLTPVIASNFGSIKAVKTNERDAILHRLTHRYPDCDWVVATTMDEAVNIPTLDCVVLAASGKSVIKLEQRMRNTRSFAGDLETGYYYKQRGHTLMLRDKCDFFGAHSQINISNMKRLLAVHSANKIVEFNSEYVSGISQKSWSSERADAAFRKWKKNHSRSSRKPAKTARWRR